MPALTQTLKFKSPSFLIATFLAILIFIGGCSSGSKFEGVKVLVIQNIQVVSMDSDKISTGKTIIISDGTIRWVGTASRARIPENAVILDGTSFYVMPGLAEMHAHIPSVRQGEQYQKDVLAMYLSQGITTIRGMLGEESHLVLREKTATGEVPSPRIFTSGPSFSGNSVSGPDQARQMVRDQKAAGYDLLKFHPGLTLDQFLAITDEAKKAGIEFSGHISYDVGLLKSLDAGKTTIDHLDRYMEFLAGEAANRPDPSIIYFGYDLTPYVDRSKISEAARLTAKSGTWNVPTNTLMFNVFHPDYKVDEMLEWPGMDLMPQQIQNGWAGFVNRIRSQEDYNAGQARQFNEIRLELTKALHDAGAGLLLGADAPQIFNPPGFSAHKEMELLVRAGLSPYEAIKTGTVNVGTYLNEPGETGKVKKGYRADLILLRVNPLEIVPFNHAIEGVVAGGRYYGSEKLENMLNEIRRR